MSTGADAMGVAAWLTPALIVAVLAGLAHPAVGQPADPTPDAAGGETQVSPAPAPPPGAHGGKPAPDAVQPKRRPVERNSNGPARERRGRGPAEERRPAENCRPAAEGRGPRGGPALFSPESRPPGENPPLRR